MKRIANLGQGGRKALVEGIIVILLGIFLIIWGQMVPKVGYQLFSLYIFLSALWTLINRWTGRKDIQENLWITLGKLVVSVVLGEIAILEDMAVYLLVYAIAVYQIFTGVVNLVTWWLYRQNGIPKRFRYLTDGLIMTGFGVWSLSPYHDANEFQLLLLGWYLVTFGITRLRDGLFFEKEMKQNNLKRRVRVTLPIFITALVPAATLNKLNEFLQENTEETAAEVYNRSKEEKSGQIEVFIHTAQTNFFAAVGHVDLCYQGRVISYGSYDPSSERLFGMVGDGVLYKCDREAYIELCKRESQKTLFGYEIDLTAEQEKAVQAYLADLDTILVPWEPDAAMVKKEDGQEDYTYAYKIRHETNGDLYKFTESKFKSYFVLSTNCALLADSIVGQAGTDILSPKGFIAPGTYQEYLDTEFEKPHSMVVAKNVYA
ncbi:MULTISPECIES: HdeD family acid-resistance protein [unclassified Streptococcus]|uniref:HdeD family acid-resistance protein n=1 Tax=unclassified Streptococcus TaxID=2608887 RepID=UPI0010727096|nr:MULTISPECIES: DUF308 domain-containing protein [unclassified Streptococcus]MBF0805613.1 DUF308 domain-containing protein [Streptococcus sp. 19428wA2_WM07]TFU28908.1 DUF308 domain-containing protein [Streptococcus sp. WM07]